MLDNPPKKTDNRPHKSRISIHEMTLFGLFAALLFMVDITLELIMNVEMVSTLIMAFTLVYRKKALIPVLLYDTLYVLIYGITIINLVYFYIWPILWAVTLLLPTKLPKKWQSVLYPLVCGLFGLCFGALYTPGWALSAGLSFKGAVTWWMYGLPADCIHAAGNLMFGLLIVPLVALLKQLNSRLSRPR